MAIPPNNLKGKKTASLPVDGNGRNPAGIVAPLVDGSGNIIGWSPLAVVDNGDGTVVLKVDTELSVDSSGIITKTDTFKVQSASYTTTGAGTTVDVHLFPFENFGVQVVGVGATPTSWTVNLEGSLDGTNFTTILTHDTEIGDKNVIWLGANRSPVLYFRVNVASLTLGSATSITVVAIGTK